MDLPLVNMSRHSPDVQSSSRPSHIGRIPRWRVCGALLISSERYNILHREVATTLISRTSLHDTGSCRMGELLCDPFVVDASHTALSVSIGSIRPSAKVDGIRVVRWRQSSDAWHLTA